MPETHSFVYRCPAPKRRHRAPAIYVRRPELKRAALLGVLVSLLATPNVATCQDNPLLLDTILAAGTRLSPGLTGRTRGVEVLDRERLETLPVRTITDALQWVLGVDVMARSLAQADLSIRGWTSEQAPTTGEGNFTHRLRPQSGAGISERVSVTS